MKHALEKMFEIRGEISYPISDRWKNLSIKKSRPFCEKQNIKHKKTYKRNTTRDWYYFRTKWLYAKSVEEKLVGRFINYTFPPGERHRTRTRAFRYINDLR